MMAELPWTSTIQVNHLFELLQEGLVVLDNSGAIVHSNQAFADYLQYAAGDLVDRRFEDLVVEGQRESLVSHLSDKSGQPLSLSLVTSEGETKALDVKTLSLVEDELHKGFCLVLTSHKDNRPDFESIVSSAYLKMVTVDTDFNITYVNPAFREEPSEMLGTPVTEGVGPQYREEFREKLETVIKSGIHQEFEFSENRDGKPATWHVLRIAPIREDDKIVGAVIAGYEITDRVNAMLALRASEEKFRGIFEHANDGITLADEEGKILAINKAQENIFGIKREAVIGMPLWELQASMLSEGEKSLEHQKYLEGAISSFFETGTAPWLERKTQGEFIHPEDGSQRFFEQTAFKIPTSKGFMLGSFSWDITEKKEAEAELIRIEKRHEQALMGADLGVWEWIRDPKTGAETWHVNKRFADIMGYTVDEIKSHFLDWSTIIHPEDYPMVHNHWERHEAKELAHYSVEYRLKTKDGGWKWILDRGTIVEWDENGSASKSSGTFLDITDRKETQAALDEVRDRYELALRGADLGVWDWNAEDDEMVFSDRWAEILGYKVDDIESNYSSWEKLIHPDDLDAMVSKWDSHVDGKTDFYSNEHRMLTKTGEWKWILERGKVVEWKEDGGTKRATGTLLDITERKMIEKALQQSEEKHRNLLENLPQRVFYKNRDSVYIAANPTFAADLGISPDEIVGKTDFDFFPKERANDYITSDRKVLETLETLEFEDPFRPFQAEEDQISHTVKAPVRDDEGNVVGILGIFWDITESSRASDALRESETKYRSLVEQSVMGLAILPQGIDNIVFANPKIGDILGYTPDELLSLNNEQINALIHPEDVDSLVQYLNSLLQTTKTGESLQVRMIHRDGSQILTEISAGGIEIAGDSAVQLSVVDITKRREAEMTLRRDRNVFHSIAESAIKVKDTKDLSRELLNSIIDSLSFDFGTFRIYDAKKNVLQYSALLGAEIEDTSDELPVTEEFADEYVIVQTAFTMSPIFISNLEEVTDKTPYLTRLRKLNASSAVAVPIVDDDQQLLGVLSLATHSPRSYSDGDKELFSTIANMLGAVLERKKAEEALQISERRYRELLTDMSEGIGIANLDERLLFVNNSFAELLGYTAEELTGMSILDIVNPEDINTILKQTELRREGKASAYTHRFVRKDGEQRTVRVSSVPSRDDTGEIDGTIAIVTDITERIIQENENKRLNESLARRVEERTAELAAANKELEAFAYSVSHDLRAPLRTVDGFSQALLEDYSDSIDDTGKDFLKRVRSAATHMGSLIEDLLVLSRVTRAEMDRTEVNLSEVAEAVIEEIRENDPERMVETKISDFVPARCDRRLIKLVVQNLIDNAWKFTGKTSDARIEFGSVEKDDETVYYVKDNGAGFNMEYSDKLFAPFQRLHPSEDFEGSGIGLATVQRIISRHGGRVWAESEINEGSTFYFTIPE